jgi:hypothetical protein
LRVPSASHTASGSQYRAGRKDFAWRPVLAPSASMGFLVTLHFVSETFQDLIQRLGHAINDAILNSDKVDTALDDIRTVGIDVFLVLEATICVKPRTPEASEALDQGVQAIEQAEEEETPQLDITPEDKNFLKRLRISVDIEGE